MSDHDRIGIIQQGLNSQFWTDYLLPLLQDKAKNALTALATSRADDDDVKRGRFQAYDDIIKMPHREIAAFNAAEAAAQESNKEDEVAEYRADYGFRSPIRNVPDVGETRGDESANTGS